MLTLAYKSGCYNDPERSPSCVTLLIQFPCEPRLDSRQNGSNCEIENIHNHIHKYNYSNQIRKYLFSINIKKSLYSYSIFIHLFEY